jgi:hypothetical protein
MDHLKADFVVNPKSEAEVIEVLRVCYAHDVPVTTRGAGTGNYGQAMPMRGGCVMHMKNMAKVKEIRPRPRGGRTREGHQGTRRPDPRPFGAGTAHDALHLRHRHDRRLRRGRIGGHRLLRWGALRDFGNIIRLRVVTMEAEPRVLDLTGDDLAPRLPRLRHQRDHHRNRDAAGPGL